MVSPISRTAPAPPEASKPRRSPSMDAELSTARAKLNDWVTCPSAKTAAGKNEVKKATDRLETVKAQIKKADDATTKDAAATKAESTQAPTSARSDDADDDALASLAGINRAAASMFGGASGLGTLLSVQA